MNAHHKRRFLWIYYKKLILLKYWVAIYSILFLKPREKMERLILPKLSIKCCVVCIRRYMKECQPDPPNFLDRNDARFKKLHGTWDTYCFPWSTWSWCTYIGVQKKSAQVFTKKDKEKSRETGTFNTDTSLGLQNAVFFYVGKVCCLLGGLEQRELKILQFARFNNPEQYVCLLWAWLKNRNGGFYQLSVEDKCVEIQKNPNDPKHCLGLLLDFYFTKLPKAAKDKDLFYCRPLTKYTTDGTWYSEQPWGKHALHSWQGKKDVWISQNRRKIH